MKIKSVKTVAVFEDDEGQEKEMVLLDLERKEDEKIEYVSERNVLVKNLAGGGKQYSTDGCSLKITHKHPERRLDN